AGTVPRREPATPFPWLARRLSKTGVGGHARPRCRGPGPARPASTTRGYGRARSRHIWRARPGRRSFWPCEPPLGRWFSAATLTHETLPRGARAPVAAFRPASLAAAIALCRVAIRRPARTRRSRHPGGRGLPRPGIRGSRMRRRRPGHRWALSLRPAGRLQPFLCRLRPRAFFPGPRHAALPVARCSARPNPALASWVTGRVPRLIAT